MSDLFYACAPDNGVLRGNPRKNKKSRGVSGGLVPGWPKTLVPWASEGIGPFQAMGLFGTVDPPCPV